MGSPVQWGRCGTDRTRAAACTAAWKTAASQQWSLTAVTCKLPSVSGKASLSLMWSRRGRAAQKRSAVSIGPGFSPYLISYSFPCIFLKMLASFFTECNLTICESEVPTCENGHKLMIGYSTLSCCPEYRCGMLSVKLVVTLALCPKSLSCQESRMIM